MYSVGMVSLWTRKKKLDMLPTSIPSPTLRVEVVSTHALSPSPASETLTTLAFSNRPLDVLRGCDFDNRGCPRTALFVRVSYENVRARDSDRGNPLEAGVSHQRLSY